VASPVTAQRGWRLRRPLWLAGAVLAALLLVVATAPLWLAGPRLGRLVERNLPRTRGHVHVGGGRWGWGTAWALLRDRPAPLVFDDVSLTDPDGVVVLRARRISGTLLRGHAPEGLTIGDLRVEDGMWRMARTADRRGIGFLRALELMQTPATSTAPHKAAQPISGPRYLHVESAELVDLDVDFDLPGWALSLRRLHGHGALALERHEVGPDAFTFTVLDAAPREGGSVSVLDGRWRTTLPFSSAQIARIAATAAAPDAITLDAPRIITGRSTTALRGSFTGVLPAPGPARRPGIALTVTMDDGADAIEAVAAARGWTPGLVIGGAHATLAMSFAGSLSEPRLEVQAAGFDVGYGGTQARGCRLHLDAALATRQIHLRALALGSPGGGRLLANGHVDYDRAAGTLSLEHFDVSPYLPAGLRQVAGGSWTGDVETHVDLAGGAAALDRVALTLARPGPAERPSVVHVLTRGQPVPSHTARDTVLRLGKARLDRGRLELPRVTTFLAGGRLTASGSIQLWEPVARAWLASPAFDLTLEAARTSVEQLLGTRLVTGEISLRARARGTLQALTLDARVPAGQRVRVLGQTLDLPRTLSLSLDGGTITLAPLVLSGASGDKLAAEGSVTTAGGLALKARATDLALRPLIAWAAGMAAHDVPLDGRLGTALSLTGDMASPAVTGTVTIARAQFGGRSLDGGVLALTTGPHGALRVRGTLIDGIPLDAALQLGAPGPRLAATLTLSRVRLDPFLALLAAPLPAATMTGEASGVLALSVTPGAQPRMDADLSRLSVSARPAGAPATAAITLQAAAPIHVAAQPGGVRLEPARFSGSAGELLISGDWEQQTGALHAQGRLNATAFAPFIPAGLALVDGALAVDMTISMGKTTGTSAQGSVAIAAPLRARPPGLPFEVVATEGRLALMHDDARIDDLIVTVGGARLSAQGHVTVGGPGPPRAALTFGGPLPARLIEPFARGYLRDAQGELRVTGRLDGPLARLVLHSRMNVGGVAFTLMPGANRIRFAGGEIAVDGGVAALEVALTNVDLRVGDGNQVVLGGESGAAGRLRLALRPAPSLLIDLPARGDVRTLATPVAIIDAASFRVRLTGVPGRTLRLGGDVFIDAAHVPPSLRRPKKPAPAAPGDTARAVLNATQLDLHIRSKPRAVTVEVAHVPDLHAALDYHLGGTVGAPLVKGAVKPAGVYSSVLFFLARLLD